MRKLIFLSTLFTSKAVALALLCGIVMLSGCAIGNLAAPAVTSSPAVNISGTVFGGSQPIAGALVQLYITGTSGYGQGASSPIASTYTAQTTGAFSFPTSFIPADCTASTGPFVYVTVSGGDPTGAGGNSAGTIPAANTNHAILLADVLGSCANQSSATKVKINEATTVAAAFALSGFSTVTSSAGNLASLSIGAPATNAQGLADAVANAILLVNPNTGLVAGSTASVLFPTAAVGTLANIAAACVDAFEYNSGACAVVLPKSTTPTSGATAPSNVYQALLNIARFPGNNVGALIAAQVPTAPFQPTFAVSQSSSTVAPNDLSLGIGYLNPTLATTVGNSPLGLTIDNSDNVWVLGGSSGLTTATYNYISELTAPSAGPAYTNTLGSNAALNGTHTLRNGRFDKSGNLWTTDTTSSAGGVIEIPFSGSALNVAGATEFVFGNTSLDQNDYDLAIDASGNVFTASYGAQGKCTGATGFICEYVEFPGGAPAPTITTFGGATKASPTVRGMAADTVGTSAGLGNIWSTNYGVASSSTTGGTTVEILTPSTGALASVTVGSVADSPFGVALDSLGGGYVTTTNSTATSALYYVPQGTTSAVTSSVPVTADSGTLSSIPNGATSQPANTATAPLAVGGLNGPGYDAVDGAGNVYIANYPYGSIVQYSPSLGGFTSPFYGFSPSLQIAASAQAVTAITLAAAGTANIYYTGGTAVNGQQVTFSGLSGNYAFLNGNTYTISSTSFNYFTIPDGGATAIGKTTTSGTATLAASNQVLFQCGPYITTTTTTTCTTVGNGNSRINAIGIDRAGTVWTVSANGALVGMIGTATPSNPVLAAGQSGMLP